MNVETGTLVTIVINLVALFGAALHFYARIAKLELKVDTIWEFIMRRALSEGVAKNVFKVNSPVRITSEASVWFAPIAEELRNFYNSFSNRKSDGEMMLEIERKFGEQIAREICRPHNLVAGSCLRAALEVAKGNEPMNDIDLLPE